MKSFIVNVHYRTTAKVGIPVLTYRVHARDPKTARRLAVGEFLLAEHESKNRFVKVLHVHIREEVKS